MKQVIKHDGWNPRNQQTVRHDESRCHRPVAKKIQTKKFGHTGTLDPNATGVLVVLCGRACKALQFLENQDKTYIATMALGKKTDTDDIWGEVVETRPVQPIENLQAVLDTMVGAQKQQVPDTSAKKIAGKKLYEYQREGKEVPRVFADIEIYRAKVLDEQAMRFEIACSSGTYIRSICRDIAAKTGNVGTMTSLVRTQAGGFDLSQAEDLDAPSHTLHSLESAFETMERVAYEPVDDVYNGKPIACQAEAQRIAITDAGKSSRSTSGTKKACTAAKGGCGNGNRGNRTHGDSLASRDGLLCGVF